MAVTLRELAKHANVSEMTVSNVLNGRHVPVQKRAIARAVKIRKLADRLGYRPHAAARITRTGRFGAVTLILGTKDGRSTLPMAMLNGMQDALAEQDMNLMVVRLPDDRLTDAEYVPRILRETSSDGLLIDYTHEFPQRLLDLIHDGNIPAVWINSKLPADCVYPDDFAGARLASRHLIEQGHRRIAYADFSHGPAFTSAHYSAADRKNGYMAEMTEAELEPILWRPLEGLTVPGGDRHAYSQYLLSEPNRPTAVICYSDTTAAPILHAAGRCGINVPAELSVLSFDDAPSPVLHPRPATILVPNAAVGHKAVEMLINKINLSGGSLPPESVSCQLLPGGAIAPMAATTHI